MKSIVSSLAALVLLAACAGEFLYNICGGKNWISQGRGTAEKQMADRLFGFCVDGAAEQLAGFFRRAFKLIKRTLYFAYPLSPKDSSDDHDGGGVMVHGLCRCRFLRLSTYCCTVYYTLILSTVYCPFVY